LNLIVPKGYTWKSGQYVFINIPGIHPLQWHPYSIASSPNGKYLSFMIKRNGDWSGKLIDRFYDIKSKDFNCDNFVDSNYQEDLREYLMQMEIEINEDTLERNTRLFPRIFISKAISAPTEMAVTKKRIILIGAGSGIAPFLSVLDDQQVAAEGGRMRNGNLAASYIEEFRDVEKIHLIFTSRESDTFSWLSPFIDRIMESDKFSTKIELHLHLTSIKCQTLPSFIFWRAFLQRQMNKNKGLLASRNNIIGKTYSRFSQNIMPTHLNIQRPNFQKIFEEINKKDPGNFYVYTCAADNIVAEARKACQKISDKGKDHYFLRYEIF